MRDTLHFSATPDSTPHRSPGITAIYNAVKTSNKNRILDLGPFINSNFLFFSQLGCSFHFEDINESIVRFINSDFDESALGLDECLVDLKRDNPFDIVLLWDALNFLTPEQTAKLFKKLKPYLGEDTLLHMVSFVGSKVPSTPCNYSVKDQYDIVIGYNSALTQSKSVLTSSSLMKALPELYVVRSFVNGEGMAQGILEQILSFQTEQNKNRKAVFSNSEMDDSRTNDLSEHIASPALMAVMNATKNNTGNDAVINLTNSSLLDLGAKVTMNLDTWKQNYNDVYSEDLQLIYSRYAKTSEEDRPKYLDSGRFLHFDKDVKFDVIITWDLLNYLDQALLYELGRRLVRHAKNGSKLVVMTYSGHEIPVKPQSFRLYKNTLTALPSDQLKRTARPTRLLTSVIIQKAFPGFFVESTYAFKPGMQKGMNEFVLTYKDEEQQDKDRQALRETVAARKKARGDAE